LKKLDVLDIINKATNGKSKKRAEIGDIEILENSLSSKLKNHSKTMF
jgi:hypothetical protein